LDMGYLYPIVRPNLFETICYFVLIPSLFFLRVRLVRFALILILLPAISLYSMSLIKERFYNDTISLSFIDVGLGDAILVEAPHGMRLIIDGGGLRGGDFDVGRSVLTPILLSKKILTLDYVINTHPHGDHAGGLLYIVNNFGVKHFVTGTYVSQESVYNRIVETIQRKGLHPEVWKRGDRFLFKNGMEVMVFNPAPYLSLDDLNNRSIVLKIVYGKSSFLCTGDMESVIEEQLLMLKGVPIRADVLKVPHHGSKYSSSLDFLRAVKPSIAVLSVGKGITGLPSLEALERYRLLSIPVLRTDLNGFIEMRSDGNRIVYNTYR
ncbi:MAG TPA: ComEC/Rec2 family competence protein, partial [Syntrophorhabdaceae bacterium]|nr:ComEC/Rec2 family competence protein [Syntrophorhabdaceae bacterium]